MSRHTYDTDIEIAGLTVPVEITFDFTRGYSGDDIDPPYSASADIVYANLAIDGATVEADRAVLWCLRASDDLHDELVGYAIEQCQPDPDAAYDAARDASMAVRS